MTSARFLGHCITELRLIFQPVSHLANSDNPFLMYVERFDIVPQVNEQLSGSNLRGQYPEPSTSLFLLKREKSSNRGAATSTGNPIGAVLPLHQLRAPAELVPRSGKEADRRLTKTNCHTYSTEFWLDKYIDKESFYALTLST